MNSRRSLPCSILLLASCFPIVAQWLNVPTAGIPRTKDGKLDLAAPTPRKTYDKPDLSGIWQLDANNFKYVNDLAADFKPGTFPIQAWAETLIKQRAAEAQAKDSPPARCLPQGVPILDGSSALYPLKIIQEPDLVVILYEAFSQFRQIFLDGRTVQSEPNPTWLGYSVGRWDGDALVVDTIGFNGKTWLDAVAGHPSTDALHITERFQRRSYARLDLELTIDDPKAYTKAWTVTETMHLAPDTELLEFVCNENEKDLEHLK